MSLTPSTPSTPASLPPLLCPACQYDLHALPPAHPCPECGHTTPANTLEFHGFVHSFPDTAVALLIASAIAATFITLSQWWILIPAIAAPIAYFILLRRYPPTKHLLRLSPAGISLSPIHLPSIPEAYTEIDDLTVSSDLLGTRLTFHLLDHTFRFYTRIPPHLLPQLPPLLDQLRAFPPPAAPSLPRRCSHCSQSHPFDLTLTHCPHCHANLSHSPIIVPPQPTAPRVPLRQHLVHTYLPLLFLWLCLIALAKIAGYGTWLDFLPSFSTLIIIFALFDEQLRARLGYPITHPELRIAPAGYQRCPPSAPLHLNPWNTLHELQSKTQYIALYSLRLRPLTFTVTAHSYATHPLTQPQLRSITTATATWSSQPLPQ